MFMVSPTEQCRMEFNTRALVDAINESYAKLVTKRVGLRRFVVILLSVWTLLALVLYAYDSFSIPLYYVLMYLAFLLVLELGSAYILELRTKRWLYVAIGAGFVGWVVALFSLFSSFGY